MAAALAGPRYRSACRLRQGPRIQGVWPAASIHLRPEPTMFCLILRFAKSRPVWRNAHSINAPLQRPRFHSTAARNPGITDFPVQEQAQARAPEVHRGVCCLRPFLRTLSRITSRRMDIRAKPLLAEDFADINMSVLQRERSGVYRGFLLVNHWFTKPDNFKLAAGLKIAYFVNHG